MTDGGLFVWILMCQMTSVERVVEYSELEREATWESEKRPPADWPENGVIIFDQVNFSYSLDGPVVLKNMSAVFRSREKVRGGPYLPAHYHIVFTPQ